MIRHHFDRDQFFDFNQMRASVHKQPEQKKNKYKWKENREEKGIDACMQSIWYVCMSNERKTGIVWRMEPCYFRRNKEKRKIKQP